MLGWVFAAILVLCTVLMFVSGPTTELCLLGTVAAEQALVVATAAVVLVVLLCRCAAASGSSWRGRDGHDRPAVVWVHGLEGQRSETPEWDLQLAQAGAVVVDVDYRVFPAARWQEQAADIACSLRCRDTELVMFPIVQPPQKLTESSAHEGNMHHRIPMKSPLSCDPTVRRTARISF